jgi:hypothetical protein
MIRSLPAEVPVAEAARALGISDRRIRAMVRTGVLRGRRFAGRWIIHGADVERRGHEGSRPGRPLSPLNAWALLQRLSSGAWPPLPAWERSRLQRKLGRRSVLSLADELRGRAQREHFRADPRILERLLGDHALVRSGVSAASEYHIDVRAPGVVEGYVPRDRLGDLVYRYALRPADPGDANVILRSVDPRVLLPGERIAPAAAVALDLLESPDPRSRRAGRELARRTR